MTHWSFQIKPREAALPATPRTRGPSPDKTSRTRRAIVAAALAEFLEKGFAGTAMAGVAERAGVAKGTPYRYFPTKEALFEGVIEEVIAGAWSLLEVEERAPGESWRGFLHRAVLPGVQDFETSGRAVLARLVVTEGAHFPSLVEVYRRAAFRPLLARIRQVAKAAQAAGELRDPTLARHPQLLVAPLWFGMLNNAILDPTDPVSIQALFLTQMELLFGPA
ncbi:TetR/AcrR family transcriptional regulator [Rhodovarius crocodyli]|uniref:TetR/AcrR family transcriptional regulator n=1 Tax=Rhodovarius crocodyli TaxID=1979269 RepID=A0A437LXG5_9PROT|nr:TetR/AcrR family transcriptional regulator [Rhodovarius crocodyli]RVT90091.1 TetR/AcrR family transcriptional regulator [Rhodovarius crocodyli]